jgi:nucleoside-diphosphate-sugar epimerase
VRVAVAGAGGAIGRPLVARLRAAGHNVLALTRTTCHHAALAELGACPAVCDALDASALTAALVEFGPDAVINQLTVIPARINTRRFNRDFAATSRLRTEGTRNLAAAAVEAGARCVVAQSVVAVYAPGEGLRHETDPLYVDAPDVIGEPVRAVVELESTTLSAPGLRGVVLRYGYIYGPGTIYARDGSIAVDVLRRRLPIIGDGGGVLSFIQVGDAVAATLAALDPDVTGVFNVVDDDPAPAAEWLPEYARLLGAPPPRRVPSWAARPVAGWYGIYFLTRQPGASNARARAELDWRPRYRSWRDGMAADFQTPPRPADRAQP